MRAIAVRRFGGPEVLALEELPAPQPGPGEVLVRIHAAGVNFADTERRRAIYAVPRLPWIPGHEGAGVVEAVGPGVDPALVGARVAFWSPQCSGTYAELATLAAEHLFPFDRDLPFPVMAALPLQGLTAALLLEMAGELRGKAVLVHAAAGGVGQILLQLLRAAGARTFGTASSAAKLEIVRALGATALAYGDDLPSRLQAANGGRGVEVVLDSVGRDTQAASLAALEPFGQLLFFGEASGPAAPQSIDDLYTRSLRVGAFQMSLQHLAPARLRAARERLTSALLDGSLRLQIGRTFPLESAAEAHALLESRGSVGKLVLTIG